MMRENKFPFLVDINMQIHLQLASLIIIKACYLLTFDDLEEVIITCPTCMKKTISSVSIIILDGFKA